MKADPNPHHLKQITTSSQEFQTHHRYHSNNHLKTPSCICCNYLILCSQKTGTAPALTMMSEIATQKSPPLQDPDQMAPQGNHGYNQNNPIMPIQDTNNYLIPDGSDRHIHDIHDKTFQEAYWKMDIVLILWNFQTSNHYFAPADT